MSLNDLHGGLPALNNVNMVEILSSNNDWPIPKAILNSKRCFIEVVSGGGAGGGGNGSGGGSGGSLVFCEINPRILEQVLTITIGAGGVGVLSGNGTAGGLSSVFAGQNNIQRFSISVPGGNFGLFLQTGGAAPTAPTIIGSVISTLTLIGTNGGNGANPGNGSSPGISYGGPGGGGGGGGGGGTGATGSRVFTNRQTNGELVIDGALNGNPATNGTNGVLSPERFGSYLKQYAGQGGGGGNEDGRAGAGGFPGGGGGGGGNDIGSNVAFGGNGGNGVVRIYWENS